MCGAGVLAAVGLVVMLLVLGQTNMAELAVLVALIMRSGFMQANFPQPYL